MEAVCLDTFSFPDLEQKAVQYHGNAYSEVDKLWMDGLNMLIQGLAPLRGVEKTADEVDILFALHFNSINSILCAHELALRGYPLQSMNLLRSPIEYLMAYLYLRFFPEKHTLFRWVDNESSLITTQEPKFNDMLQAIESASQSKDPGQIIRNWIKEMHKFSHVSAAGIRMVTSRVDEVIIFHIGPRESVNFFGLCAAQAYSCIMLLLGTLDDLRQFLGVSPLPQYDVYLKRAGQMYDKLLNTASEE